MGRAECPESLGEAAWWEKLPGGRGSRVGEGPVLRAARQERGAGLWVAHFPRGRPAWCEVGDEEPAALADPLSCSSGTQAGLK